MITAKGATKALFILKSAQLAGANDGQALVWAELFAEAVPLATDDNLMAAVKKIAISRTAQSRGGSWVTFGDVVEQVRAERRKEVELEERRTRQIEGGSTVSYIDAKSLMRDAKSGLSPEEIGRRARERAEGKGDDAAKGGAK